MDTETPTICLWKALVPSLPTCVQHCQGISHSFIYCGHQVILGEGIPLLGGGEGGREEERGREEGGGRGGRRGGSGQKGKEGEEEEGQRRGEKEEGSEE